jgi:hypothetical protein
MANKKYKLLDTPAQVEAAEADMKAKLGIPDSKGTLKYAEQIMIDNPEHTEYGRFIFPILLNGTWKSDQHFDASELVDFDPNWAKPIEESE